MGWLFSLWLFVIAITVKEPLYFCAAGLFAIAGSIALNSHNH